MRCKALRPYFGACYAPPMHNQLNPGYYGSQELRGFGFKAVGENVAISKLATVVGPERIEIGNNVRIDAFTAIIVASGWLRIGSYVHICTACMIGARGGVEMLDFAGLSHGSKILSASDDFSGRHLTNSLVPAELTQVKAATVRVGRHAAIGADVLILPGVQIGEGAAVGCKSLVTRNVPDWEIHRGIPARKHGERSRRLLALEAAMSLSDALTA